MLIWQTYHLVHSWFIPQSLATIYLLFNLFKYCALYLFPDVAFVEECQSGKHSPILDVQKALKALERICNNSDKSYICKRLEQASNDIIHNLSVSSKYGNEIEFIVKDTFKQTLDKILHHCKKLNVESIGKACEIYFYNVIYPELFPYVCAKNQDRDAEVNMKILAYAQWSEYSKGIL